MFDYKGENQIVYQKNGVTIRSWPAIHAGDGAVSFALEWNGMKVSPDDAWAVAGSKPPHRPPAAGTVPDPMTDFIKAGRWQPAIDAQNELVGTFKKEHDMK